MDSATEMKPETLTQWWHDRLGYPAQPETLELHVCAYLGKDSDDKPNRFSQLYGARIKAMGGHYSDCRGAYTTKRYVTVPATVEGVAIAGELIAAQNADRVAAGADIARVTVILRGLDLWENYARGQAEPSWHLKGDSLVTGGRTMEGAIRNAATVLAERVNHGAIARADQIPHLEGATREAEQRAGEKRRAEEDAERVRQAAPDLLAALAQLVLCHDNGDAADVVGYFIGVAREAIRKTRRPQA